MRDPDRIVRVLYAVREFWVNHPDMRLGQIISNASFEAMRDADPFHMEDEALVKALIELECPVCRDRPVITPCHECGRE